MNSPWAPAAGWKVMASMPVISPRSLAEVWKIIHDAGGLCYYDGANLNAVMGVVRPGDMGFDVIHLNLHKTLQRRAGPPHPRSRLVRRARSPR